jgi:hypothetical protein
MIVRLPKGYRQLEQFRPLAVALEPHIEAVATVLATGTLHAWASAHPDRRVYAGRGPVYAAPLPDGGPRVVVRHGRHGGLLARLLSDLYLPPTPAVSEILISAILARAGIPTPPIVAAATYRAGAGLLRRFDVATLEVDGLDLAAALSAAPNAAERARLIPSVARLLAALLNAGAWHQDLNAKNILIAANSDGSPVALALDVDRVRFSPGGDPQVRDANHRRLARSMHKRRALGESAFDDAELQALDAEVRRIESAGAAQREAALQGHMP